MIDTLEPELHPSRENMQRGVRLLHDPVRNKSTAFTEDERDALGLRGLLPPRVQSQDRQVQRVMDNLGRKSTDLERYIYLAALQDRNERLFYRVLGDHLRRLMPIIYTPTVGEACQQFGHIFRRPRGLFVTANDLGRVREILHNWPHDDVRVIVVTDGERILGLGDLGANGMGIPIGKLSLYTACAGLNPVQCLPVMLDAGTENEALLKDPLYLGLPRRRLRGEAYDVLVDEFVTAVGEVFPRAVIQLEDFANRNAFRLLDRYQDQVCLFDDDIQGTGSVVLAGVHAALRIMGGSLSDQKFLFLGAGEAGVGIATLIGAALQEEGLSEQEARERCWFFDSTGLVVQSRERLQAHKLAYAHDHAFTADFLEAVRTLKPTALIGVAGTPGAFTQEVLAEMAHLNERPLIMALSNPTSKSECTAVEAYRHTSGRAVFASGSPFDPVEYEGTLYVPGQANNAYIFPGVGLGAVAVESTRITDRMFFMAARALSEMVSPNDLAMGRIFPSLGRIRDVSLNIAVVVAEDAFENGFARIERPDDLRAHIANLMFDPGYQEID